MTYTSEFHGPIDGHFVIPGTHTAAGGTTNFHFGCPSAQGRCDTVSPKDLYTHTSTQNIPSERASLSRRCRLRPILTLSTGLRPCAVNFCKSQLVLQLADTLPNHFSAVRLMQAHFVPAGLNGHPSTPTVIVALP
jgi:hypothetical protein